MNATAQHLGERRSKAWWEPTFNPALQGNLQVSDWKFVNSTGPKQAFLSANALLSSSNAGQSIYFRNLTFEDCDIQGHFEHSPTIFFENCRFHGCDFAHSQWVKVNFKECQFFKCSLALTDFVECEFRDCNWEKIGIQGRKTSFNRTYITNPEDLISSAFSAPNPNDLNQTKSKGYQNYRLEESKAHLARTLLFSHEEVGDDKTYYKTAKLHDIQQIKSKIAKCYFLLLYGDNFRQKINGVFLPAHTFEFFILWLLGTANGWGSTILRPITLLLLSFILFGEIYHYFCLNSSCCLYWQKSFDITTIAGYTNQASAKQSLNLRITENAQLVISIILYTIFFSTVVARSSRSR